MQSHRPRSPFRSPPADAQPRTPRRSGVRHVLTMRPLWLLLALLLGIATGGARPAARLTAADARISVSSRSAVEVPRPEHAPRVAVLRTSPASAARAGRGGGPDGAPASNAFAVPNLRCGADPGLRPRSRAEAVAPHCERLPYFPNAPPQAVS